MPKSYLEKARQLIRLESQAVAELIDRIDERFIAAVETIFHIEGKIIVSGVGKSGLVGRRIAATLASTGTPSFFLHAAEAKHGDLGVISKNDAILLISNSGETEELINLMPAFKSLEIPIIGFVGSRKSTLAGQCDVVLSTHVPNEACPLGIVPTASAIVMSALGDALAIALLDKRGFEKKDFAGLHPGGALGKKLLTTVADLMHTGQEIPLASVNKPMREVLFEMTEKGFGIVGIINAENQLIGVITDGDLRRGLEKTDHFLNSLPDQLMSVNPKWISADSLAIDALHEMETYAITALFVFKDTKTGKPLGIIHIHDILRHGIMSV